MKYLINGGCGFLGSNIASEVLRRGEELTVYDNLSRVGSDKNLAWLRGTVMKNAFLYHRASARRAFNTKYIMYMVNKCVEAGSRESHEPRLIGEVIKDLLMNSNEPLAVAYRKRHQTDTHLNVDNSQQLAFEKRRVQ